MKIKRFNESYEEMDDLRYKYEEDKSIIYDSETNKDICMYFDDETREWLLNILNSLK